MIKFFNYGDYGEINLIVNYKQKKKHDWRHNKAEVIVKVSIVVGDIFILFTYQTYVHYICFLKGIVDVASLS
jgi:hypothetical protein